MAWMIALVADSKVLPSTLRATMLALGATPRMRMLQPAGSGCASLTKAERSCETSPCAAIVDASPISSAPPVADWVPSPLKSW